MNIFVYMWLNHVSVESMTITELQSCVSTRLSFFGLVRRSTIF